MKKQIAVIGIEMHCEMKSNSKVFSCARNSYSDIPNENIAPLDMAFPGVLPVVNKKCVQDALKVSLALKCVQPEYMYFDRKNYYYPDLPKGYQITQVTDPVGINGKIEIEVENKLIPVLIHDVHLEEDTAGLEHYSDFSALDYNRSGVPLLELVTEPCFHTAKEAITFIEEMIQIYRYLDVSEADTKKGQIRCDVNVSIMDEDAKELGTRVEVKGVNSIRGVYDVIQYEINRQSELKEAGKYHLVEQETRRWNEEEMVTMRMRSKVDAIDYKYFVEPNIPKYKITKEWLEEIKKSIPALPNERKKHYINDLGLSEYDANIIIKEKALADYYEECVKLEMNPKTAANWLISNIVAYLNKEYIEIKDFYLTPQLLKQIIDALEKGNISSKQAKEIFNKSLEEKKEPKNYITSDNTQISDQEELTTIINNVLQNNSKQIEDYHNGKTNLFDYFVGQVMKETRGKANPSMVKEILKSILDK